jgi:hypothetical protein
MDGWFDNIRLESDSKIGENFDVLILKGKRNKHLK